MTLKQKCIRDTLIRRMKEMFKNKEGSREVYNNLSSSQKIEFIEELYINDVKQQPDNDVVTWIIEGLA